MKRATVLRSAGTAAAAVLMTACAVTTQVDSLKPVAGDPITGLSIASSDVLLAQGVEMKVVPVCSFAGDDYTCKGSTMSDDKIIVRAQGSEPETMTITVGGERVFDGSIDEVLTKAAQR